MKKLLAISALLATALLLFALTETETWDWPTDAMSWTFVTGNPTDCSGGWDDGVGNAADSVFCRCYGRNKDDAGVQHVQWVGTWEDLGVTPGNTVSTVQMTDVDTRCFAYIQVEACEFGAFELRTSADALVATLWTGRTPTGTEGSWTAEGSQSAQSVGSLTASSSSIELWMHGHVDLGNNGSAECKVNFDNLDISIEHAAPAGGGAKRTILVTWRQDENGFTRAVQQPTLQFVTY